MVRQPRPRPAPARPRIAVHKFSSCDGCQLAFLNLGEALLSLAQQVELVHFAEAGPMDDGAEVDIAFIEGSVSTAHDQARIHYIRQRSRFLVTIGACATAGGIQALRNLQGGAAWRGAIYADAEYIDSLDRVTPIAREVPVDFELWGCPVNREQIIAAIRALLFGVTPVDAGDKVCMECKRRQAVCVLVTQQAPCLGPVTRTGCGALCPAFGRACYGCYGPAENPHGLRLGRWFEGLGMAPAAIADRFLHINNQAEGFLQPGRHYRDGGGPDDAE